MLRVVKMDQGATDICCWWYVLMQMGIHHLKQWSIDLVLIHTFNLFFKEQIPS